MPENKKTPPANLIFEISVTENNTRLDKALASLCPDYSRSLLKKMILSGNVMLNNKTETDPSVKVFTGNTLELKPVFEKNDPSKAENIPLDIIFEDDDVIVINKPPGMVVHPGAGNPDGTLVNALIHHYGETLSRLGGEERPGLVHRIDKDTSGLMVVARTNRAHTRLAEQLADRSMGRIYNAFVWGVPNLIKGTINAPIGRDSHNRLKMNTSSRHGKEARTHYTVLEKFESAVALCSFKLESGRTHQIRVHCSHFGYPVIGDPLYGIQPTRMESILKKSSFSESLKEALRTFPRQALHAGKLYFQHPVKDQDMNFTSPYPEDLQKLYDLMAKDKAE